VNLIDAGQAPELLVRRELDAQQWMAVEHAPAIAMAVNGKRPWSHSFFTPAVRRCSC
jgi:hypothetical protein